METVRNNLLDPSFYFQEETVPIADNSNQQLSQEDFFALLTEQLAQQDPTNPTDNDQLVAQMTSFSAADGINQLNQRFDNFASSFGSGQALQATGLIGQSVLVSGDQGATWEDGQVLGSISAETDIENLQINIVDQSGRVVRSIDGGNHSAGNIAFGWDGTDNHGNPLPHGQYKFEATATANGQNVQLQTTMNAQVTGAAIATTNVSNMRITIEDQVGQVVRTIDVGDQRAGNIEFGWDGTNNDGFLVPPGTYRVRVQAEVNGEEQSLPIGVNRRVDSVSLAGSGGQGVVLNLAGEDSISITDVISVGN